MSKKLYPTISPYPGAKAGYVGEVIAEILPYEGIKQYFEVFNDESQETIYILKDGREIKDFKTLIANL